MFCNKFLTCFTMSFAQVIISVYFTLVSWDCSCGDSGGQQVFHMTTHKVIKLYKRHVLKPWSPDGQHLNLTKWLKILRCRSTYIVIDIHCTSKLHSFKNNFRNKCKHIFKTILWAILQMGSTLTQIRACGTQAPRFGHLGFVVKLWALIRDINPQVLGRGNCYRINHKLMPNSDR